MKKILILRFVIISFFLQNAAWANSQNMSLLPSYHANVLNNRQSSERELLLLTVKNQDIKTLDSLLKRGFDINEPDIYGYTILAELMRTISKSDTVFINCLLSRGACLDCGKYISYYIFKNGVIKEYVSPLENAILNNDLYDYVYRKYDNLNKPNLFNSRKLIEAAIWSLDYKIFSEISKYYSFADINSENEEGQTLVTELANSLYIHYTALMFANKDSEVKMVLENSKKIITFLENKGAILTKANKEGETLNSILKSLKLQF